MVTSIRIWADGDYTLEIFNYNSARKGRALLSYHFYHINDLIFEGREFSPSPFYHYASDKSIGALLGFLSLKPGDTDKEYFEDYTQQQLAFVIQHGEYLSLLASELENK